MAGSLGNWSNLRSEHGMLVEYSSSPWPLALVFEFNPMSITRTRTVTVKTGGAPGSRGGYDFRNRSEAVRAALGVTVEAEKFSFKILLDATDRMNAADPIASLLGVQPELDVIRSMLEPKMQLPTGAHTLAALGQSSNRAFSRDEYPSVLLFKWGIHALPVFMTHAQIEVKGYLPSLIPYRAEATLNLQIIESRNPFYEAELQRQFLLAGQIGGLTSAFTFGG